MKYSAESKVEIAFVEHGARDCAFRLDTTGDGTATMKRWLLSLHINHNTPCMPHTEHVSLRHKFVINTAEIHTVGLSRQYSFRARVMSPKQNCGQIYPYGDSKLHFVYT